MADETAHSTGRQKCRGKYPSAWMDIAKPCCGSQALPSLFIERLPEHTVASFKSSRPQPILLDAFVTHTNKEAVFFLSGRNASTRTKLDDYIDYNIKNIAFSATIDSVRVACKLGPAQQRLSAEDLTQIEKANSDGGLTEKTWNQFHLIVTCPIPISCRKVLSKNDALTAVLRMEGNSLPFFQWPPYTLCPHQLTNSRAHEKKAMNLTFCTAINPLWAVDESDAGELQRAVQWIQYHLLMGVEHVFVYMTARHAPAAGQNESKPNYTTAQEAHDACRRDGDTAGTQVACLAELRQANNNSEYSAYWAVLGDYVAAGTVTLIPWPFSPFGR